MTLGFRLGVTPGFRLGVALGFRLGVTLGFRLGVTLGFRLGVRPDRLFRSPLGFLPFVLRPPGVADPSLEPAVAERTGFRLGVV